MKTYRAQVGKFFPKGGTLGEVLGKISKLPPALLEEAACKGAVWVQRGKGKILRERDLAKVLSAADTIIFNYDAKVLSLPWAQGAEPLFECKHYGVWLKPAGMVAQGTEASDHASLLRFIELERKGPVWPVHRLDRETAGLMVVAYSSEAAGKLSELFQKNQVWKEYEAVVLGELPKGTSATVDAALDDKKALTHYEVLESGDGRSLLKVVIETGRLHQIRRHLDHIGHPVMGDPKYGRGNKNREGLKLMARTMTLTDPWSGKIMTWTTEKGLAL